MRDHQYQEFGGKAARAFIESQLPLYRGDREAFARVYGLRLRDVENLLAGGPMSEWMMIRLGFQFDKKTGRYILTTPPEVSYYPPVDTALADLCDERDIYRDKLSDVWARSQERKRLIRDYVESRGVDFDAMAAWIDQRMPQIDLDRPLVRIITVEVEVERQAEPEPVVVEAKPSRPGDDSAADTEVLVRFIKATFPTVKAFAVEYGFTYSSVNNVVRGERRAGLSYLRAIKDAMAWDAAQKEIADAA